MVWSLRIRMMTMRYVLGLTATLAACCLYVMILAPLIEGEAQHGFSPPPPPLPPQLLKEQLAPLLPANGWELDPCYILKSGNVTVLFRDHQIEDDGTVQVEPLTLVIDTVDNTTAGEATPASPPMVVRAPGSALLKFENGLQLGGNPGALEHGQLAGEVQIYRPSTGPDQNDAFSLVTRNVQISPERIYTLHECSFRFGRNQGHGKHLTVDLFGPSRRPSDPSAFAGIERIQLGHVDELVLHREGEPTAGGNREDLLSGSNQPLTVRCAGPMAFDFSTHQATFVDDVMVRSLDGTNQLNCEDLTVLFESSPANSPAGDGNPPADFRIRQLRASGTPAVLTATDQNAQVTADCMEFDMQSQTVVITSRQSAWLMRDGQQIQSPRIEYTFDDSGRLGTARVAGPGSIRQLPDEAHGEFVCHWTGSLALQNDGEQKVLSIDGAEVQLTGMRLQSQQLHVWMRVSEEPGPRDPPRQRWSPARLVARDQVRIQSPDLEGDCSEAVAFWPEPVAAEPLPPGQPAARRLRPARSARTARVAARGRPQESASKGELSPSISMSWARPRSQDGGRTRFVGRQVQLQMLGGPDPGAVDEITVDGDIVVQQQRRTPAGDYQPVLEIRGDKLRAIAHGEEQNRLFVAGSGQQPATVAASQLTMTGLEIHLDQAANRLWIDGPGELQLHPTDADTAPEAADPDGGSLPAPLHADSTRVSWAGGMVFDGQRLYMESGVESHARQVAEEDASLTTTTTRSAALSITLNQYVDFQQADAGEGPEGLQAERLVMVGWMDAGQAAFPQTHRENPDHQVWIASGTWDASGRMTGNRELFAPRANYDITSGMANCTGRGTVIVRQLAGSRSAAPPGRLASTAPSRGPIDFVRIEYDESFGGNLQQRQLKFSGNVHTFYVDCQGWNEVPRESVLSQPDRRGLVLDCQRLELAQWSPDGGPLVMDLRATGNARAEGSQFDAEAERISYFEGNGLVTIEAPERGNARFRFNRPGQTGRGSLTAKRVYYNLASDTWEVDQMQQIEYSDDR